MSQRAPTGSRRRPGRSALLALLALPALATGAGCGGDGEDDAVTPTSTSAPDETTADDDGTGPTDGPPAPDPSTLQEAIAPSGLGAAPLPTDSEGVVALFEALPDELLGAEREIVERDPGTIAASYDAGGRQCSEIGLQGIDLSAESGAYPDDWRADDLVALFASGVDWDVEAAGHEAALYWVTFETYCGGEDIERDEIISSAAWGEEDGSWVFFVGAADAADRDTLLTSFAEAARAVAEPGA